MLDCTGHALHQLAIIRSVAVRAGTATTNHMIGYNDVEEDATAEEAALDGTDFAKMDAVALGVDHKYATSLKSLDILPRIA